MKYVILLLTLFFIAPSAEANNPIVVKPSLQCINNAAPCNTFQNIYQWVKLQNNIKYNCQYADNTACGLVVGQNYSRDVNVLTSDQCEIWTYTVTGTVWSVGTHPNHTAIWNNFGHQFICTFPNPMAPPSCNPAH